MNNIQEILYKCKQAIKDNKPIDAYTLYQQARLLKQMEKE